MALTAQQRAFWVRLKQATLGDGSALEDVFATGGTLTTDDIENNSGTIGGSLTESLDALAAAINKLATDGPGAVRRYYLDSTQRTTTSSSWTQLASNTWELDLVDDYIVHVNGVYGGSSEEDSYEVRVLVNGNVVEEFCQKNGEDQEDQRLTFSTFVEVAVGNAPNDEITISIEGRRSGGTLRVHQWRARAENKGGVFTPV